MPLDTSTYHLAHLRLDGRRWNELRRLNAQISTQAAADGSSYLEMGNTKVICTVTGPAAEVRNTGTGRDRGGGGGDRDNAVVLVEVGVAGFSSIDRKRRGRGDKRTIQMQDIISSTFQEALFTRLYPHSTINLALHVLSQDGSLLAACLNAATLALVDAGIPMKDYTVACTSGLTAPPPTFGGINGGDPDPLLDLNTQEEQELPFLTVATLGASENVSVLFMESRVQAGKLEGMLAVGVDGCKQVRGILDAVVRERGRNVLGGGAVG